MQRLGNDEERRIASERCYKGSSNNEFINVQKTNIKDGKNISSNLPKECSSEINISLSCKNREIAKKISFLGNSLPLWSSLKNLGLENKNEESDSKKIQMI